MQNNSRKLRHLDGSVCVSCYGKLTDIGELTHKDFGGTIALARYCINKWFTTAVQRHISVTMSDHQVGLGE